ncbi:MAG: type II secretory pathway, component PulD, partial [Isosphaeraceae bacterium]|nr:type II secretory pathway, component PulD [Isosphaeraceae bacterium]
MGTHRTLTILLTVGAWCAATEGAPQQGAAPAGAVGRAQPPVAPSKYVEAGIKLYNLGDMERAAKYFKAASDYRDMLTADDASKLDAYVAQINAASPRPTPAPTGDAPRGTSDGKQQARWMLQQAREQIRMGNYAEAGELITRVQSMNVKWSLFDDTPAKVQETLDKARPKAEGVASAARDRESAKRLIKDGRQALAAGEYEKAEAIALEVNGWGLNFSVLEDNPSKLASAARALRRRDALRNAPAKAQPSQGVYEALVQEARTLASQGKLEEAEAKARRAQGMNVVPALSTERAEEVLHDIAMAKARGAQPGMVAQAPVDAAVLPAGNEPPAIVAEREGNRLLAQGDQAAAETKFREAAQLETAPAPALAPPGDTAVQPTDANAPPVLAAPTATPPALDAAPLATEPAPVLALEAAPAANKGEEMLTQARALFSQGNFPAARQLAEEAKKGGFGVEAKAEELIASISLSQQGGALQVYEAALDSMRKGDVARAKALLSEVSASGAELDEGMRQKIDDLLAKLPADGKAAEGAGRAVATDALNDAQALEAQRVNAEVGTKVAEARRWLETDPDKSIQILTESLASVKAKDLPPTVARTMTRRLEVAIELAKKDKATFDVKMKDKTARAEIENKKLRILEADKAKKEQVAALMSKAEAAQAAGDWALAETLAVRVTEIDPNEVAGAMLAYKARLQRHYETGVKNKKAKEEGFLAALDAVDEAAIVNPDVVRDSISMPKDFKDLTNRRRELNKRLDNSATVASLAIQRKMEEPVSLNFKDQTLDEAITFLQNYTGLNIVPDNKAFLEEGITRETKVNLSVNGMKLKTALKFLLRPLGLTFRLEDDALLITSPQSSTANTFSRTYPVGDLVIGPNRTPAKPTAGPTTPVDPQLTQTGGVVDATQINNSAVSVLGNGGGGVQVMKGARPTYDMMPLIQLITTSVAPGTWQIHDENGKPFDGAYGMGGGFGDGLGADTQPIGSIIPYNLSISLIIRHTAEVHEEIADLLKQLRKLQDLQVSIEVRFITLADDFFEMIGVNFDMQLNSNVLGPKATFAAPNPGVALFPTNSIGGGGGGVGGGGGGVGGGGLG